MNSQIIQVLRDHLPQRLLSKIGIERTLHRKQSSRVSCVNEFMLAKFEGTLLGALIGDCVGKRIESIWGPNLHEMLDDFRTLRTSHEENDDLYVDEENIREYTDDMAMTMSVCDSLVACADFDMIDVADRFQRTFATNPNRGYSSNAIVLFRKLSKYKRVNELKDRCLQPAMELFHGEGSYGNGGGKTALLILKCFLIVILI
jgi:ADP-ribosylglycohydrolase